MQQILSLFTDAVMKKCQGDFQPAANFIEGFDAMTTGLTPEFRETLRRGMFLILKARVE